MSRSIKLFDTVCIDSVMYRLDGRICAMAQMPVYECTDLKTGARGYVAYAARVDRFTSVTRRASDAMMLGCAMVRGAKTR